VSGWVIARRQPSTAVWGGIAAPPPAAAPVQSGPFLGWVIIRRQPSRAMWRSQAGPQPGRPAAAVITGDYDGKTWWKKRWILRL
jgi:hypothetical protein